MRKFEYELVTIFPGPNVQKTMGTVTSKNFDDAFDFLAGVFNGDGQLKDNFTCLTVFDDEDSLCGSITRVYSTRPVVK